MTEAEKAFEFAERLIEEARERAADTLDFNREETRALERFPESIGALDALRILDCGDTQISDLSPLSALVNLTELSLDHTQVSDLGALSGLANLTGLSLDHTQVSDLGALSGLVNLTVLELYYTQVSDLGALSDLEKLMGLWLNNTEVSDLRPLRSLRKLADDPGLFGLTFKSCAAARSDPRIAEISEIEDHKERARTLFDYLEDWEPPEALDRANLETALRGPILAESLVDIERDAEQFQAASLTDGPAKPIDRRHEELIDTLGFIAKRMSGVSVENRMGKDVRQNFADYAQFIVQQPVNGRILWFLAGGIRSVLADPYLSEALDGFDRSQIIGFVSENDALVQEYYPDAMRGAQFETETAPEVLSAELPKSLAGAKDILDAEDARGVFAPNVSDTLEMLTRRADGARRGYATAETAAEREAASKELQRVSVQSTALLGRIKGRLTEWLRRTGNWVKVSTDHAKENPMTTTAVATGAAPGVNWVVQQLTPIFEALWKLIGNLPLPPI